jgi:aspartyl-tRNA(Asn)/glutamyl-tRNA(Gln) amidotransferase subunit B
MEKWNLSEYDANVLTASKDIAEFFEKTVEACNDAKSAANWIMGEISAVLNEKSLGINEVAFAPEDLGELINLINKNTISGNIAKKVLKEMFETGKAPMSIVEEKNLAQMNDVSELKNMVLDVMKANPQSVEDLKGGKEKAIGFLVGQIMKQTKGKANPGMVNKLIKENREKF